MILANSWDSKLTRITSTTTTTSDSARRPQGEARQLCAEGALAGEEARLQELPVAAQRAGAERVVTSQASRRLIEEFSPSTIVVKSQQNRNEIKVRSYDNPGGILGLPRKLQQVKFLCILASKWKMKSSQSHPKSTPNPNQIKQNLVKAKPNPAKIILKQSRIDESRCSYEPYTSPQAQY